MNANHPEDAEPGHWDDLAALLGVSDEGAPPARVARTEDSHSSPSPPAAPAMPAEEEPQVAGDLFADLEEDEDAGPDEDEESAATPGEAGDEPKKRRRRRRRRRKKGDAPAEATAAPSESVELVPDQVMDDEPEATDRGEGPAEADEVAEVAEVEDVGDEDDGPVAEPVSDWNMPSWNEIIAALYRPPDR